MSPLAEAKSSGAQSGGNALAEAGRKIQFFDYIWPAYHQIRNERR